MPKAFLVSNNAAVYANFIRRNNLNPKDYVPLVVPDSQKVKGLTSPIVIVVGQRPHDWLHFRSILDDRNAVYYEDYQWEEMYRGGTYPEHEKLQRVRGQAQVVGEFLEWLEDEKRVSLDPHYSKEDLIAGFFGINQYALEYEKQLMLDKLREGHK